MLRPATPLAILLGAAFALLLLSVLSTPIIKAIPLGQVAGQKMLLALGARIPEVVRRAQAMDDDDVTSFAPGLALVSARHETQYSRLFRS